MTRINHELFSAFRDDHVVLGRGLHELRSLIMAGNVNSLKAAAQDLDQVAGGHIAFEEEDFYPALKAFLSGEEIEDMYAEHARGAETLAVIAGLKPNETLAAAQKQDLLERVDAMEQHVSECGELFGALGGLNDARRDELMARLLYWRKAGPTWTGYANGQSA